MVPSTLQPYTQVIPSTVPVPLYGSIESVNYYYVLANLHRRCGAQAHHWTALDARRYGNVGSPV